MQGAKSTIVTITEPPLPLNALPLIEEIITNDKVLQVMLEIVRDKRELQMCNFLLQVLLEIDPPTAVSLITKAWDKEIEACLKRKPLNPLSPRASHVMSIVSSIFRETTGSMLLIVEFFRTIGVTALQAALQDFIVQVESHSKAVQNMVGEETGEKGERFQQKADLLQTLTAQLVSSIVKIQASKFPPFIRYILKYFHTSLVLKLADSHPISSDESAQIAQEIGAQFIFKRFFCLGITCPSLFALPEPRTEYSQDSLITLADILTSLVGLNCASDACVLSPHHGHTGMLSSDCETLFLHAQRNKHASLKEFLENSKTQLQLWTSQLFDINEAAQAHGAFAYFAMETYGPVVGEWICKNALEFIYGCPEPLDVPALFEFLSANKSFILAQDLKSCPNLLIGPGRWSSIQYGRSWNMEIKLPRSRTEDTQLSLPFSMSLKPPETGQSIIDWTMEITHTHQFLVLVFCPGSTKVGSSQKYIRAWKKYYQEITSRQGLMLAVSAAPPQATAYVSKKLGDIFPMVFDHQEHLAAHYRVAGYGTAVNQDDVSVVVVDNMGAISHSWDGITPPAPKVLLAALIPWITEQRARKPPAKSPTTTRRFFRKSIGENPNSEFTDNSSSGS